MENIKPTENDWLTYSFTGLFYKNGDTTCRRELHIKQADYNGEPDLLVIMMNPGGSHPIEDKGCNKLKQLDKSSFVPTIPDLTQFKVIEFMEAKCLKECQKKEEFRYAVVLNLLDKCQTKSEKLNLDDKTYSCFYKDEKNFDFSILEKYNVKNVLIAWGCNPDFKSITINLFDTLKEPKKNLKLYGIPSKDKKQKNNHFYLHPLANTKWLEDVQQILPKNL